MRYPLLINEHEYALLTRNWKGPAGAALNACWEYCRENDLITVNGGLSEKGRQAVQDYEKYYHEG